MTLEIIIDDVLDPISDDEDVNMVDMWDNLTNNEQRALMKSWIDDGNVKTVRIYKKD